MDVREVWVFRLAARTVEVILLGRDLILAAGNGFAAFGIVAFGSTLVVVVKTAIKNRVTKKNQTKEI